MTFMKELKETCDGSYSITATLPTSYCECIWHIYILQHIADSSDRVSERV